MKVINYIPLLLCVGCLEPEYLITNTRYSTNDPFLAKWADYAISQYDFPFIVQVNGEELEDEYTIFWGDRNYFKNSKRTFCVDVYGQTDYQAHTIVICNELNIELTKKVVVHEMGHSFGLVHSINTNSPMQANKYMNFDFTKDDLEMLDIIYKIPYE